VRDELEDMREKLRYALHPRRHEPDFHDDDGNGEVEESAGDMTGASHA